MEAVRVLQILTGLNRGGLETFVMNVYRTIDKSIVQFDFLVYDSHGDYTQEILELGGIIYEVPARNKGISFHKNAIDRFFRENAYRYSAIHFHTSSLSSIYPLIYARKYHIKVRIIHSHSSSIAKNVSYRKLHLLMHYMNKSRLRFLATHYLGCSDKANKWLYSYTGIFHKSILVKNGIILSDFHFSSSIRNAVRSEFGISENEVVLGHVGRFIPLKNHIYLLDILGQYIEKFGNNVKLMLVGEGDTLPTIKTEVQLRKLEDYVIFTGSRPDVNYLLQGMDAFLLPSWFEGFPVVLVEAQASGLAVVVSDKVTNSVNLSKNLKFLSIDAPPIEWAEVAYNLIKSYGRTDNSAKLKESGFDIETITSNLLNIYMS